MPRGDRTGPAGAGPMTGRGAGICAGYGVPGYLNNPGGRGFGRGRGAAIGGGRRWRHQYYATGVPGWARGYAGPYVSPVGSTETVRDEELVLLKREAQHLEEALHQIKLRIDELSGQQPKADSGLENKKG